MVDNVYDPLLGEPSQRDEREASAESCRGFKTSTSEPDGARARQKLVAALAICAVAVAAEVVGGVLAHSLALLTDAAHLLSDLSGYAPPPCVGLRPTRQTSPILREALSQATGAQLRAQCPSRGSEGPIPPFRCRLPALPAFLAC